MVCGSTSMAGAKRCSSTFAKPSAPRPSNPKLKRRADECLPASLFKPCRAVRLAHAAGNRLPQRCVYELHAVYRVSRALETVRDIAHQVRGMDRLLHQGKLVSGSAGALPVR